MVLVASVCGKLADKWAATPGWFWFLTSRNVLTVVRHSAFYLIALQVLDGVSMDYLRRAAYADHGRSRQGNGTLQFPAGSCAVRNGTRRCAQ